MARNLHAQYAHQYSFPKVSQQVTNTSVVEAAALEGGRIAQLFCGEQPKLITDMSEQELDEILDSDSHSLDRLLADLNFNKSISGIVGSVSREALATRRGQEIPNSFGMDRILRRGCYGPDDQLSAQDLAMLDKMDGHYQECECDEYGFDIYKLGQARGCRIDGVDIELLFDKQGLFHETIGEQIADSKLVKHNTQPPTDPVDLLTNHGPMRLRDKELDIHEGDHNAGAKPQEITRKARRAARRLLDQLNKN